MLLSSSTNLLLLSVVSLALGSPEPVTPVPATRAALAIGDVKLTYVKGQYKSTSLKNIVAFLQFTDDKGAQKSIVCPVQPAQSAKPLRKREARNGQSPQDRTRRPQGTSRPCYFTDKEFKGQKTKVSVKLVKNPDNGPEIVVKYDQKPKALWKKYKLVKKAENNLCQQAKAYHVDGESDVVRKKKDDEYLNYETCPGTGSEVVRARA